VLEKMRSKDARWFRYPILTQIPFWKTPVRIAVFYTKFSAIGFFGVNRNAIAKARYGESYKTLRERLLEEGDKINPDESRMEELKSQIEHVNEVAKDRMARAAIGTLFHILGCLFAAAGMTTWAPPKDDEERRLFYDAGYKAYAFRIGDSWIPMAYLGPAMLAFGLPAAIKDILYDNPDTVMEPVWKKLALIGMAGPRMIFDQLPLEGLSSLLETVQGKTDRTAERYAGRTALQFVPFSGFLRWVNNFVDPTYRRPQTIGDTIAADIPGLSDKVAAIKDSKGLPAEKNVWDVLSPWKIGRVNSEYEAEYLATRKDPEKLATGRIFRIATDKDFSPSEKARAKKLLDTMTVEEILVALGTVMKIPESGDRKKGGGYTDWGRRKALLLQWKRE
jgi:hypothetical protein